MIASSATSQTWIKKPWREKASPTHLRDNFKQWCKKQGPMKLDNLCWPRALNWRGPGLQQIKLWFSLHGIIILEGKPIGQDWQNK